MMSGSQVILILKLTLIILNWEVPILIIQEIFMVLVGMMHLPTKALQFKILLVETVFFLTVILKVHVIKLLLLKLK